MLAAKDEGGGGGGVGGGGAQLAMIPKSRILWLPYGIMVFADGLELKF